MQIMSKHVLFTSCVASPTIFIYLINIVSIEVFIQSMTWVDSSLKKHAQVIINIVSSFIGKVNFYNLQVEQMDVK